MPWKLVVFLLVLTLFVFFMGFNWEHASTISFGFAEVENVPIVLSLSFSFLLGAFFAIPFTLASYRKRKQSTTDGQSKEPVVSGRKSRGRANKAPSNDLVDKEAPVAEDKP